MSIHIPSLILGITIGTVAWTLFIVAWMWAGEEREP